MLPTNLLIVSMVVFLATTVFTAPVEEKEQEQEREEVEVEVEATEEGELSEEEDDEDDSKSQDKIEGVVGVRQTTTMAVVASGGSGVAAAVWSHIQDLSVSASSSQSAGGGTNGGSSAGHGSDFAVDLEAAGSLSSSAASQPGNGQKLMNGGGGREGGVGADSQTVISSGVTAAPSTDQNSGSSLDSLADPAYHSDISNDQSGPDHSSLSSGLDQSLSSSVLGSSHSAGQGVDTANASSSSHSEAHRVQIDGADSPDTNGNGRQTLLNNTNAGLHMELTGPKLGNDVTESPLAILHTDSLDSASHGYSHTDLVSMATDSTWTVTGSADPTGTPLDSSHPAVTDNTQVAGSVTEQYNPSGQGPEGTENVELEDTC